MDNAQIPVVEVKNLKKYFPITRGALLRRHVGDIKAVDGVDFTIFEGETLGLVGESGSGKTTVGRTMLRLYEPTDGEIIFKGVNICHLNSGEMTRIRRQMQMIFQDPYASLNPRMRIGAIVRDPLEVHDGRSMKEMEQRVAEILELVGIDPALANRYPHEFSSGQRQRVGIARALVLNPDLIVCDEPIASLDVSIQAQVVNLLEELQARLHLTYLFIAHDLSMIQHISDRIAVMYLGKLMESTSSEELYTQSLHPYTKALISAIPVPDPYVEEERKRIILEGNIPSPAEPPKGCNFNTRCPYAEPICFDLEPEYREVRSRHHVACHLVN